MSTLEQKELIFHKKNKRDWYNMLMGSEDYVRIHPLGMLGYNFFLRLHESLDIINHNNPIINCFHLDPCLTQLGRSSFFKVAWISRCLISNKHLELLLRLCESKGVINQLINQSCTFFEHHYTPSMLGQTWTLFCSLSEHH